jgi:hypothetical protein
MQGKQRQAIFLQIFTAESTSRMRNSAQVAGFAGKINCPNWIARERGPDFQKHPPIFRHGI